MSGSYLTFAVRRVMAAFLIAVLVSAVTFVMLHVLRPESFFDPRALPVQLGDYLWSAFTQFDLGNSRQPPFRPVSDLIFERAAAAFSLFAAPRCSACSRGWPAAWCARGTRGRCAR